MGALDALGDIDWGSVGLQVGLSGLPLAAAYSAGIPLPPSLVAGFAAQAVGQGLTAAGTSTETLGPTDEQIGGIVTSRRTAGEADIASRERRASQQAASQAAAGNTLGGGLISRDFGDVGGAAARERASLEGDLGMIEAQLLASRQHVPKLNAVGLGGRALATTGSILTTIGGLEMMSRMGAPGAGAGVADGPDAALEASRNTDLDALGAEYFPDTQPGARPELFQPKKIAQPGRPMHADLGGAEVYDPMGWFKAPPMQLPPGYTRSRGLSEATRGAAHGPGQMDPLMEWFR